MRTINGNSSDTLKPLKDPESRTVFRNPEAKCGLNRLILMGICFAHLMGFSVLFSFTMIWRDPPAEAGVVEVMPQEDMEDATALPEELPQDQSYDGLLPIGFDESSCVSRCQSILYHKELSHKPAPYLISRLRRYEALHKRCGPSTELYNKTLEQLRSGQNNAGPSYCNYVVWMSFCGLGNRILSIASAFLYALLTDRVLLVDRGVDVPNLFCEPFPGGVSWLLPTDFPITKFSSFNQTNPHRYGNLLKNYSTLSVIPSFLYLHLVHDYDDQDKLFFCEQNQEFLQKVPWLLMKTDNYIIPTLFSIPSFEEELSKLFPKKETIFHFLGRYLFHPTNHVWGLIMRYYHAYLDKADEKLGIQVRELDVGAIPFQTILDQILSCTMQENLLPQINKNQAVTNTSRVHKIKAVLMTSLNAEYYEHVRNMYWEYPTVTGEVISVHQPSHEEYQQTLKAKHDEKAWAEMYLLSLTDKLVTSGMSTFGYVAQGLGGLKPWILYRPENVTVPNPPCRPAMSMEPCFHSPPYIDCKKKTTVDTDIRDPHVRYCEDVTWGLKLFDNDVG